MTVTLSVVNQGWCNLLLSCCSFLAHYLSVGEEVAASWLCMLPGVGAGTGLVAGLIYPSVLYLLAVQSLFVCRRHGFQCDVDVTQKEFSLDFL